MLQVAKCINDRNGGMLRHAFNSLLVESAQYNRVNPAFEIMRDVAKFFSRIDSFVRLVHKKCRSAQAGHARFKRKTRTQRGLLKEHGHLLTGQGTTKFGRQGFYQSSQVQNSFHLCWIQIARGNQITGPESFTLWYRRDL